jgi:beta-lactamase class A
MPRLSLRASVFVPVLFSLLGAAHAAPATPPDLQARLQKFVRYARPAQLGIAVLDLSSGQTWGMDRDVSFMMMSVFKAPVAAAILSQVEAGTLSLDQAVTLSQDDVVAGSAVPSVGDQLAAGKTVFSVRELLTGAVSQSDNTAVDALIRLAGGPQVITTFLHGHGIDAMHVETDERGISRTGKHLKPGEAIPAHETAAQTLRREKLGYAELLADTRNRSTPDAAIDFLRKLAAGDLLTPASTELLIDLMRKQTKPFRLRGGIPPGADFADKCGTGTTVGGRTMAWNDIAIMTLADGRRIFIAVFMKDTPMTQPRRDKMFADIARAVAAGVPPLPPSTENKQAK